MLGTDVVRAASRMNHEVLPLAHEELDICDAKAVEQSFVERYPHAVINCAGFTDVDGAEDEPERAMAVNEQGARNVASVAASLRIPVIYPSTDYVFDGTDGDPYLESDQTDPQSQYGRSKLAGEIATAQENPSHFIVRTAWLFGTSGRNFVDTMLSLADEVGEVLVVMDQIGSPTYTGHLAQALLQLLDSDFFGIHHIAGEGECSWYEFAIEIFRQSKVDCRVMAATTDMVPRKASRPAYSVLGTEREHAVVLPDWHEGLAAFLTERARAHA
jgi:dTDP-4-dehydrorhamnose reductase